MLVGNRLAALGAQRACPGVRDRPSQRTALSQDIPQSAGRRTQVRAV